MKGNVIELCQRNFRLDIRRNFFLERMVRHGNRLPRKVLESPTLEMLTKRVDVAVGDVV